MSDKDNPIDKLASSIDSRVALLAEVQSTPLGLEGRVSLLVFLQQAPALEIRKILSRIELFIKKVAPSTETIIREFIALDDLFQKESRTLEVGEIFLELEKPLIFGILSAEAKHTVDVISTLYKTLVGQWDIAPNRIKAFPRELKQELLIYIDLVKKQGSSLNICSMVDARQKLNNSLGYEFDDISRDRGWSCNILNTNVLRFTELAKAANGIWLSEGGERFALNELKYLLKGDK